MDQLSPGAKWSKDGSKAAGEETRTSLRFVNGGHPVVGEGVDEREVGAARVTDDDGH
jgi:hypothetical protein